MKSSTNGTSLRGAKKSSFTSEEICRILETCKTVGVKEFYLGELRFVFNSGEALPDKVNPTTPVPIDHEKQSKEALELDEMQEREDRLRLLAIEDPVEYERQIVDEELEPDDESDTDE